MTENVPNEIASEFKRAQLLECATKVFLTYGFAKTTMDDIARAASMSRPALYLLFKNKADIYRYIATTMLAHSVTQAETVLEGSEPFMARLEHTIDVCVISMVASFATTPHGAEFMDRKSSLADIIGDWRTSLLNLITIAIESEARRNGVDLVADGFPPDMLAGALLDALDGIKSRTKDPDAHRRASRIQIKLIAGVLQI